jgi:hypothetical protein
VNLILTNHARLRMTERNISEADIRAVLSSFHTSMPGTDPNTIRYRGRVGVAELSVVAERPGVAVDPVKIVTVY